jgi:magnesium transporter
VFLHDGFFMPIFGGTEAEMELDLKANKLIEEIVAVIRSNLDKEKLVEKLDDYHANDIAQSLEYLTKDERLSLYEILGDEWVSEILSYVEEPEQYINELGVEKLADIINEMDSDDAADLLEKVDESVKEKLRLSLDDDVKADIQLINSYDEDEVGSLITNNYICISKTLDIRGAMHELIKQAGDNDNISTIYVVDENGKFSGAIDLKDLIIARQSDTLDSIIIYSYPYFYADEKISDSIEKIKDYAEDSLPVLNHDKEIVGIITAQDVVEAVDDEMGEDYAKLAGLTAEEDLQETTKQSIKKRLPWLVVLLVLGMGVSAVVGAFENVVAILPIVICFQSLILDMAGNVGTQSLAVTIRVLMDEELAPKDKLKLVFKEAKVGFSNGFLLGILAIVFLGLYIFLYKGYDIRHAFLISLCVGVSLLLAMIVSSLVGTLVPLFFKKIKVDPAVASGPLITTVNDLVAVVIYYGLSWVFLIQTMHILG